MLRAIIKAKNPLTYEHISYLAAYSYWQTKRHTDRLEEKGLIRRTRPKIGLPYHYEVLCSF